MSASTLRFAVIGDPIAHSRSPEMHEAAFRALDIDATYTRERVEAGALGAFVARLAPDGYRGVNVTLPHKQAIAAHLDEVSDTARAIGAVNTVTVEPDGRCIGDNTDAPGLVRSLEESGFHVAGEEVVILGAGGAARAAVVGLSEAKAKRVTVAARRVEAAKTLVASVAAHVDAELAVTDLADLRAAFATARLVVQATSATLASSPDAEAFAAALPLSVLPDDATVIDLVYEPRQTAVLVAARARGLACVDGLGMLVHQGALAFERWLGRPAPVAAMRAALDA